MTNSSLLPTSFLTHQTHSRVLNKHSARRTVLAVFGLASLILGGCATTNSIEGEAIDEKTARDLAPLMEAADQTRLECTSTEPLSTQRTLHELVFACSGLGAQNGQDGQDGQGGRTVEASLAELRDAGWRLMSVDVGQEKHDSNGQLGLPLTINVIKLF